MNNKPYIRWGDEWRKEVMKLRKSEIVDLLAEARKQVVSLEETDDDRDPEPVKRKENG